MKKNWPIYIGIGVVSLACLALEVILNRMFALTYWYHFAFIIISIALFGIGLGGLLIYFINPLFKKIPEILLAVFGVGLALSIPLCIAAVNQIPLEMEWITLKPEHMKYFTQVFLLLSIPFVLSGLLFSGVFTHYNDDINRIYFFDLVGGGLGCVVTLLIFPGRGPIVVAYILSYIILAASAFFLMKKKWWLAFCIIPFFFLNYFVVHPKVQNQEVRISAFKHNPKARGEKIYGYWDNFAYVTAYDRPRDGYTQRFITADYSCFTYFHHAVSNDNWDRFKYTISYHQFPYVIRPNPNNVGIVGVGAGDDVLLALANHTTNIYGVEFNGTVLRLFMDDYSDYVGNVGHLSNVHVYKEEGRFFIRNSKRKYDILVFNNTVAQTAVSSGAFTIAESYVYTVEAMMDYLNKTVEGGVVYFSNPFPDLERIITVAREAFRRLGREDEFKYSIFASRNNVEDYRKCKVVIKNGKFTPQEARRLTDFAYSVANELVYAPYQGRTGYKEAELITTDDIETKYVTSLSEIRPTYDDWPYFTQRTRRGVDKENKATLKVHYFYPEPFKMLKSIAAEVLKYALLFLLVPLIFLNLGGLRKLPHKIPSLIYFMSLGMGFMLLEIVLMQKYTLILGHPMYAFSIVLAGLLVSTGIGSFVSKKIENPYNAVRLGLLGILGATLLAILIVKFLGGFIVGFPFFWRVLIVLLLIGANGFFMGFMMPSGIRAIGKVESSIPWMYAVNSVFSVVASFLSVLLSIWFGFNAVLLIALGCYTVGALLFAYQWKVRAVEA